MSADVTPCHGLGFAVTVSRRPCSASWRRTRYGTAAEVAAFVSCLAGPEAAYITGSSLNIDGGFTA
ncbi:SDR family oxidoreductase [Amycolatopsis thermoflava]|uniref:SDR family oxidoreductase n=1 Tax=Amycolatopsis thermoflava TaxID=84480 RepID=UPI003EBDB46A